MVIVEILKFIFQNVSIIFYNNANHFITTPKIDVLLPSRKPWLCKAHPQCVKIIFSVWIPPYSSLSPHPSFQALFPVL